MTKKRIGDLAKSREAISASVAAVIVQAGNALFDWLAATNEAHQMESLQRSYDALLATASHTIMQLSSMVEACCN